MEFYLLIKHFPNFWCCSASPTAILGYSVAIHITFGPSGSMYSWPQICLAQLQNEILLSSCLGEKGRTVLFGWDCTQIICYRAVSNIHFVMPSEHKHILVGFLVNERVNICTIGVKNASLICMFFSVLSQNAVSMYCRLGFAIKKGHVISPDQLHPSWKSAPSVNRLKYVVFYL